MRVALFICLAITAVAAAPSELSPELQRAPYPRFIEFPDGDGNPQTVDLEAEPDYELLSEIERNPANNVYLLFTRKNPTSAQTLVINNAASITGSNFNKNLPTLVIVHGWLNNQNSGVNEEIRDAALGNADVNVIVMEWRRLAIADYVTAVRGVPAVGRGLGQFLNFLNQVTGAPFNTMHLAGFSLGAHVVGSAGRELGGRVARVTGLDPAGPLWHFNSDRLNPKDGIYVEAIHTDGDIVLGLGIGHIGGDVDFYPNGGSNQPGCLTGICDHNRSWEFFASTITNNHLVGKECASSLQISLDRCTGKELHMGNNKLDKKGSGEYRVNTGRRYPY